MSVNAKSFYGDDTGDRARLRRRLEASEAAVRSNSSLRWKGRRRGDIVDKDYPETYRVFPGQGEAIAFAKSETDRDSNATCSVFAAELDRSGRRHFIVCHREKMWAVMQELRPDRRHFYEVIPEGSPCRLYLDVEHSRRANPNKVGSDGEERDFEDLLAHLAARIKLRFGRVCYRNNDLLVLDSSTESKFSRHVLVVLDGLAFWDNRTVGRFVRDDVLPTMPDELRVRMSEYRDSDGKSGCGIVDVGVYTKNRNFRLFLSSKFGKSAVLKLHGDPDGIFGRMSGREVFLKSLVTSIPDEGVQPVEFGTTTTTQRPKGSASTKCSSGGGGCTESSSDFDCKSPFREIDRFISDMIKPGYVRKCRWKVAERAVEYEIAGEYRYCGNVGRHHRSNNVRLVVLVDRGVFFQMCHDQECRDYSSAEVRLPDEVQPWLQLIRESELEEEEQFLLQVSDSLQVEEEEERMLLQASEMF